MTDHRSAAPHAALLVLAAFLGVLPGLTGCGRKPSPSAPPPNGPEPGGDVPLSSGRLKGARLAAIQSTTTWDFADTRFALANSGAPLPANVAASVLGPGASAKR